MFPLFGERRHPFDDQITRSGGDEASQYTARRLPELLADVADPFDPKVLHDTMLALDKEYLDRPAQMGGHGAGTTCVFAVAKPVAGSENYQVTVAHAGDARCLWISADGEEKFVTKDHKPYVPCARFSCCILLCVREPASFGPQ